VESTRSGDLSAALRRRASALKRCLFADRRYASESYAQEGEDLILKRVFEHQPTGFYVDVGAHHPMRLSNTCIFYRAGWRGINIDAMPGSMLFFRKVRPRDVNIEIGISERPETLRYFMFDEPALNTFAADLAEPRGTRSSYKLVQAVDVSAFPLSHVLARHIGVGQEIDFLTVDVEGCELQVLRSNDWQRFAPRVVVAETLSQTLEEVGQGEIVTT
jgi:FkbM family methyltransferase